MCEESSGAGVGAAVSVIAALPILAVRHAPFIVAGAAVDVGLWFVIRNVVVIAACTGVLLAAAVAARVVLGRVLGRAGPLGLRVARVVAPVGGARLLRPVAAKVPARVAIERRTAPLAIEAPRPDLAGLHDLAARHGYELTRRED